MPIFDHSHPKKSNKKHDWNPVKYLNVLYHNRTQKQLQYLQLQKFNKLYFLGALDMSGYFHQKSIIQLVEVLILMNSKMNPIHNVFRDIVKTFQTCYFKNFGNARLYPSKNISINF